MWVRSGPHERFRVKMGSQLLVFRLHLLNLIYLLQL
jgi:hypothetical protein